MTLITIGTITNADFLCLGIASLPPRLYGPGALIEMPPTAQGAADAAALIAAGFAEELGA